MKAALVHSHDHPPRPADVPEPIPGPGQVVVDVVASALHQLVIGRASGRHYSARSLPLPTVPGVDGVGTLADGTPVFFTAFRAGGTMAERVVVDEADVIPLPDGADPATIAAVVNPAMSGWLALRVRAGLRPGERVLVLGATGSAGTAAVQLAQHLGAGSVIAAGRNPEALAALDADRTVSLEPAPGTADPDPVAAALAEHAADVDVVLDYLWGPQTERALGAILGARADHAQRLRWVEIGAMAGGTVTLPGAHLRGVALELSGSGIGSVDPAELTAELRELLGALAVLPPTLKPARTPLSDVETAWTATPPPGHRTVFTP